MSFVTDFLGGKSSKTTTATKLPPLNFSLASPRGQVTSFTGNNRADLNITGLPNIRPRAESAFDLLDTRRNVRELSTNPAVGDIQRLRGLESPFIDARVRPLEQRLGERRGALDRGLRQRGLFGPLAQRELQSFDREADRNLGDARALATADSLNAVRGAQSGLLESFGVERGLTLDVERLNVNELTQALNELRLGQNAINSVIASMGTKTDSENADAGKGASNAGTLADTAAKILPFIL